MGEDIAIHAQNITDRKQAYQEQLFWQDMLRYVLENSFSSVAVMDNDMNYMFVSESFLKNFRINENDITQMNHYKLFPNLPDIFKSVHKKVLAGETIRSEEEEFHHADGRIDYTRYLLRPWYQINGEVGGIVMYIEFITERKQREQKNIEDIMKYRQQQKLESIGTLASGVAHEINNPIMGIINYAQLILDEYQDTDISDYAREIIAEGLRISDITKDLLFYSSQQKQEHSLASVNDIILKTLSLIRSMLNKDQIDVQLDLNDDLPKLKCRSQQIQQIVMNLLTNAKDALNDRYPSGNPDKVIIISNHLFNEGGRRWIRVIVEDHGNGISPDVQQRVFDPFFSTKSRDIGTGLGLPISYGIVRDHHGRLFFETETGQYTRFILELPVDNGWDIKEGV
jgi:PAS domain S-box-containing protein